MNRWAMRATVLETGQGPGCHTVRLSSSACRAANERCILRTKSEASEYTQRRVDAELESVVFERRTFEHWIQRASGEIADGKV